MKLYLYAFTTAGSGLVQQKIKCIETHFIKDVSINYMNTPIKPKSK